MQDYQPRPQKVTCTRHVVMADQMDDDADPQFLPGFPRAEDYSKVCSPLYLSPPRLCHLIMLVGFAASRDAGKQEYQ